MNEAVRCGVCCEVYCEGTREPRMLPCGHTFCRSCLDVNQSKCGGGHLTCLTCPTKHQVSLQHLPISFALLDLATNYNDSQPEWCSVHGDGLNYWCRECKRLLCGLCLYTGHPLGHQVTPARALLHKKRAITSQLANINCIVEKVKQHTVAIFHDTVSQILSLSRWTGRITEVEAKVAALTAQQDDITGVEAVEDYEHKVKRLAEEAEDIVTSFTTVRTKTRNGVNDGGKSGGGGGGENGGDSGNNSDVNGGGGDISRGSVHGDGGRMGKDGSSGGGAHGDSGGAHGDSGGAHGRSRGVGVSGNGEGRKSKRSNDGGDNSVIEYGGGDGGDGDDDCGGDDCATRSGGGGGSGENKKQKAIGISSPRKWPLTFTVHNDEGKLSRVQWRRGKLHFHAFDASSLDADISIKLSRMELKILCDRPEVFLELGVEGRCLGRVYIQLWWHLRRAHHFLALCLGTLGPSYVGSNFKNVVNKGEGKEHVQAGDYITPDGSKSGQGLMDNLEWGGEHRGKAREGVVAGASCGSQNLDACFLICTIAHPDRHFKCPFGQVVSGLRLVRQVVNIDPISQVTITDCGFVTL